MEKKDMNEVLFMFPYAMDAAGEVSPQLGELADTRGWVRPQEVHHQMKLYNTLGLDEVENIMSHMAGLGLLVKVSNEELEAIPTRMTFYTLP
jgi:hypothetical protein